MCLVKLDLVQICVLARYKGQTGVSFGRMKLLATVTALAFKRYDSDLSGRDSDPIAFLGVREY